MTIHYQEAFKALVNERLCCEINSVEENEDKISFNWL
jgi:hypothetical protein